jgi:hypothetical protein
MHVTTNVMISNPAHGEVYSKKHYVITFVSDLWQVDGFPQAFQFFPTIKRYSWNIAESGIIHHKPTPNHTP